MDYKSLLDFFRKVETEYPVQQWAVDGIHIWPLVRIRMGAVFSEGIQNIFSPMPEHTGLVSGKWWNYIKAVQKSLVDELKLFCMDIKHRERLAPCDVVMLGDAADRNVQMPTGEVMDHNLDPIYDALQVEGYRIFKFEEINSDGPRYPRWTRSYTINGMMLWAKVRRKWNKGAIKDIQIDTDLYQCIMQDFSRLQPGIKPISLEYLIYDAIYMRFLADEFQEKLTILKPRLAVLECWYSTNKMALSVAAHKLGIPVVDIQHGGAGGCGIHPVYCDWNNMPYSGYEIMPDYMWAWSQEDREAITRWGKSRVIPILGGHPMSLIWDNSNCAVSRYYRDLYDKLFDSECPVILFTLQWGTIYPDWIMDFINQSSDYTWLIRLHPHVDDNQRNFLQKLKRKENIKWEGVGQFPLEILLQKVSLHITMNSAVVLDCEAVDCCSVVLNLIGRESYASQIDKGIVYYANNRNQLVSVIHVILSRKRTNNMEECMKNRYSQGCAGIRRIVEIIDSK